MSAAATRFAMVNLLLAVVETAAIASGCLPDPIEKAHG
jgi:hypothetical protein